MVDTSYLQAIDPFAIQPNVLFGIGWQVVVCVVAFAAYLLGRAYFVGERFTLTGEQFGNFIFASAIALIGFQLVSNFGIRWYGLAYLTGFVVGYLIIRGLCSRGRLLISHERVGDFVFAVALGTIVGGRLGYCVFYSPELLIDFSSRPPFWGVLAVHNGGMASHGGIIGIVFACYLFARKNNIPTAHLCDLTTLGGTVGVFFGRIANFINCELVGRPASEGVRWAVKFPQDIFSWPAHDPNLLVSLGEVVKGFGLSPVAWGNLLASLGHDQTAPGRIEGILMRIVSEVQNGNEAVSSALKPLLTARHPSQLYEALLEGLFLFVVINLIWLRPRKPGMITGAFLSLYSVVRIIGEQFRMPDPQIGFEIFGLTRGQILSVVLFVFGLAVFLISNRLDRKAVGGWLPERSVEPKA